MTDSLDDPRPLFGHALDQAQALVAGVRPDELALPTPCAEYDVRALLGHLVTVVRRIGMIGAGGDPFDVPHVVTDVAGGDWAAAFADGRREADRVWAADELLDAEVRVPWGRVPGRVALLGYTQELAMHGWDLAIAVGRLDGLDPAVGEVALAIAQRVIPAEGRAGMPFGPVVPVLDDADVYTRLAGWLGRQPYAR